MDLTIVTPSYRQLEPLGCCIASVADQPGVNLEHIVQDGGTDGFSEFSQKMAKQWPDRPGYRRVMISGPDQGMYDAINRGLAQGSGAICAYLNCDEQYLPGALQRVGDAFASHPDTDLFFGDALVVDGRGQARCWRKVLVPLVAHTWTCHFSAFTAAMFFRRKIFESGGRFDTRYRAAADAAWYLEACRRKVQSGSLGFVTSTFMESGENLGIQEVARMERRRLNGTAPLWMRILRPGWLLWHRGRRWMANAHQTKNISYQIYTSSSIERQEFTSRKLRATWPGRMWGF